MEYFTINELCKSETAVRLGIPNRPGQQVTANLERLVELVLDPLRRAWGSPVMVNSGYRCRQLNEAVGGARNSQHMQGLAADLTVGTPQNNRRLAQLALELRLPFDQMIDEHSWQWLHISVAAPGRQPRGQAMRTVGRGYAAMKF